MRALSPIDRCVCGRIHPAFLLFWIAIAAVAYFGMDALVKPRSATVVHSTDGGTLIVIPRSLNGHYYVEGMVNGHPTLFMVDTGATMVAIDPDVARAARLPQGRPETFNTAAGPAPGTVVPRQSVSVGGVRIDGLSIAVIDGVGKYGLLGQNFLRHLEVLQSDNQMTLRARTAAVPSRP